jgi:hypothetical protein
MRWHWRVCAAIASALLNWPAAACAGDATIADAIEAVAGHPAVSYLDLVKAAVPDLALDASGRQIQAHTAPARRHIAGKDSGAAAPDPLVLGPIEDLRFTASGKPRIALLADFGVAEDSTESFSLLLLFDDAPKPTLLDAVEVGVDRETGFDDHPLIGLGPGDSGLVVDSGHSNSNQSYLTRLLILVRGDRFELIDSLFLFADDGCGWRRDEVPVFTARRAPGSPYGALGVTVTEALTHDGDNCGDATVPHAYKRTWRGAWRWDARRGAFTERLHQLERLAALNEARF